MLKNKLLKALVWLFLAGGGLLLPASCRPAQEADLPPTILECPSDGLPPCTRPVLPEGAAAECAGETARQLSANEGLSAGMSFEEVCRQVGLPDWQTGSGLAILIYQLEDGSEVWLGFPGLDGGLLYAYQVAEDGSRTSLFHED